MRRRRVAFLAVLLVLLVLPARPGRVAAQAPKKSKPTTTSSPWLTLSGNAPSIIAKGGFSGMFPDSSSAAYEFTYISSSSDAISWCDVQLTKDGSGICLPDILLDNSTNVKDVYPDGNKNYLVNGVPMSGWFSFDYDITNLSQVSLIQGIFSRTNKFDASMFPILAVEDVVKQIKPAPLWLNIQHDMLYRQKNLSVRTYLISLSKRVVLSYVSSPEVAFLSSILDKFKGTKTMLIFCFLGQDIVEPTTNMTYGSLLKNLTYIKTFASGILVPKDYIWPITSNGYLEPHTSVVLDAHKEGLEVYASNFANDASLSYNYSYDPLAEILSFVDNGIFSVDGVITQFPITASEAIGCFSHVKANTSEHGKPAIMTHYGASGMYPDCTDLAYQQAVKDGADYIDCPVQVTGDGTLICMSSINLMATTTVMTSPFRSRSSLMSEIYDSPGIFTFNLTWEEIKNLKPTISNPELIYRLYRNPLYKNAGNFLTLSDFLTFAKDKDISGIVISIENAAFLAEKLGYSVTTAVISALEDSGYRNQTVKEVIIQSTNSSVLIEFKNTKYKLMYMVDESISDAVHSSITDMKQFAQAVAISKDSIYPVSQKFTIGQTDLVQKLQSAGFMVYVYLLSNEFVSQPWDFFSDPTVQINTYAQGQGSGVDGIITDFPATAAAYRRNTCSKLGNDAPKYMNPVEAGSLLQILAPQDQPPALAPMPVLQTSDVVEPPLPPASMNETALGAGVDALAPASHPSAAQRSVASMFYLTLLSGALLV